jgi:hypothetical protein
MAKKTKKKDISAKESSLLTKESIYKALEKIVCQIPKTKETISKDPLVRSRKICSSASLKAAAIAGGLALPPGPLGILTIIPDLIAIWKIQRDMVADIAGASGKQSTLNREQMLYCLFKHAASQIARDLVVRVGTRTIIKRTSLRFTQNTLRKIGIKITQRIAGKTIARWAPIVGAVGVGAYAYYDTASVGKTAIELFSSNIEIETGG